MHTTDSRRSIVAAAPHPRQGSGTLVLSRDSVAQARLVGGVTKHVRPPYTYQTTRNPFRGRKATP